MVRFRAKGLPGHGGRFPRWGRLVDGWWVRDHAKPRKRPFHPIHRLTPFDGSQIQNRRATVIWCHANRMIREEDWRSATGPVFEGGDDWVGYSFFQEIPQGTVSGTLFSQSSSSTPAEQGSRTSSSLWIAPYI